MSIVKIALALVACAAAASAQPAPPTTPTPTVPAAPETPPPSELVDFSLLPLVVFQGSDTGTLDALQIPMAFALKLGSVVKLSTELGIYTGDGISLRAKNGGRVQLGAALDVKLGPVLVHAGAGVASLATSSTGMYPSVRDSVYVDLNVKYVK